MLKLGATLETGGGLWSREKREVQVTGLGVRTHDEDFGELRVYFTKRSWNIDKHGLIYTDNKFLKQLKGLLKEKGFAAADVYYSEQGMQGDNYVSLDVGPKFLRSWHKEA